MVKVLPSKISILPTCQCYLENPASLNACFPLFNTPFFYFKLHKISTDPTPLGTLWLVSKSNLMDSRLLGINQMKLLI